MFWEATKDYHGEQGEANKNQQEAKGTGRLRKGIPGYCARKLKSRREELMAKQKARIPRSTL